jgi:multidrug efflux pump subunit AcrB
MPSGRELSELLPLLRLSDRRALSDVVRLEARAAPTRILRRNGRRIIELSAGMEEAAASKALAGLALPPGVVQTIERQ